MVIYGHDKEANDALFDWLRAIGLQPREWNQLINATGAASPYIGQVLEQALEQVQAVVAFFTPDEHVIAAAASTGDENAWRLQARPNVLIEAGMALIAHPKRTVLAVLGNQELPSDLAGRHAVRLSHTNPTPLHDLATRLQQAGCDTDLSGADWLRPSRFPDRDQIPQAHHRDNPSTLPQGPPTAGASSKGPARTNHSPSERRHRRARTLTGHTDEVWSVAFSPDGILLATASSDQTARTWNLATGKCVRLLGKHTAAVYNADFHPDGTLLATASGKTARTWDLATGECVHAFTGHTAGVDWEVFSPDGTLLATASSDKTARIWDLATGECVHILTGHTDSIVQVAFSPDGALLATASNDKTARIWDLATGECARTLTDHTGDVWSVAFSPDGTLLATASSDKTARTWNLATGRCIRTLTGHPQGVPTVTFSPDGTLLATASDDTTARIWNLATGKCVRTLTGHTDSVFGVAFSPDGTLLATASRDKTTRIWNC
jgi:WD40 repeat protein